MHGDRVRCDSTSSMALTPSTNFWQSRQGRPYDSPAAPRLHITMAKKKKSAQTEAGAASTPPPASNGSAEKKPAGEPSTSALIICRNK
jgi:hypothetical protein